MYQHTLQLRCANFQLREGDLLKHQGDAIVLPSYAFSTGVVGSLAPGFRNVLQSAGVMHNEFGSCLPRKIACSPESVDHWRLGQMPKLMKQRDFERREGAKAVSLSHAQSGVVVERLDHT